MSVRWELITLVVALTTGQAMAASQSVLDIPTECSARIFDAASGKFFAPALSYVRLRVMPTYGEHVQMGLAEDPSGELRVQYLVAREGRTENRDEDDGCPALALSEERNAGRPSKIRRLFGELQTLRIPAKFPSILYLDSTSYELKVYNQGHGMLLSWTGLDEPKALKTCSLCRWVQNMRRVFK